MQHVFLITQFPESSNFEKYFKEKENAFIKNCECGLFSLVFVIKLVGSMIDIFSVGLQKTDKSLKAQLNV